MASAQQSNTKDHSWVIIKPTNKTLQPQDLGPTIAVISLKKVFPSWNFFVAISDQGTALSWGDNSFRSLSCYYFSYFYGQLGLEPKASECRHCESTLITNPTTIAFSATFITAAVGWAHTLLVSEKGEVFTFGGNYNNQLGRPSTPKNSSSSSSSSPIQPQTATNALPQQLALDIKIRLVAAGLDHSLLLSEDGHVYSFGCNKEGQLGLGDTISRSEPTLIPNHHFSQSNESRANDAARIEEITCGWSHCLARTQEGLIYSWGWGGYHQLGLYDTDDTAADQSESKISDDQMSYSSTRSRFVPSLIEKIQGMKMIKLAAGGWHSVCLSDIGEVYSWGWNGEGQLGHKDTLSKSLPSRVKYFNDVNIVSIACGWRHTLCLAEGGSVFYFGKCALSNNEGNKQPQRVFYDQPYGVAVDIQAGGYHSIIKLTQ